MAKKPTLLLLVALLVYTPTLWCHGIAMIVPHRGRRRKLNTQDGRKPRPSNAVPKINTRDYQINESHNQIYQGNHVPPAKDFMLSDAPTSIPITRWALKKGKAYLYMISDLIGVAKEA